MKKLLFLISVVLVTAFFAGCSYLSEEKTETTTQAPLAAPETTSAPSGSPASSANAPVKVHAELKQAQTYRISMTANGFSPNELTVHAGDTVNFVNDDAVPHWPASGHHPTHELLPSFDALHGVPHGSTYAYTFTKIGVWPFHDHLNAASYGYGKITVTE